MPKQWTVNELADKATQEGRPVTARHIRRLCRQGINQDGINARKLGRDWIVLDSEVRRFLSEWLGKDFTPEVEV